MSQLTPQQERMVADQLQGTVIALHPLACTGPTGSEGCVCGKPRPMPYQLQPKVTWQIGDHVTSAGVDGFLDNLESLVIALGQRRFQRDQLDRFARVLQHGEHIALMAQRKRKR